MTPNLLRHKRLLPPSLRSLVPSAHLGWLSAATSSHAVTRRPISSTPSRRTQPQPDFLPFRKVNTKAGSHAGNRTNDHQLSHVDPVTGAAHMVDVGGKEVTSRAARATCSIHFSNDVALRLIRENGIKKGDVLGTARIAGIMAAKRTSDLIPLCHPLTLSSVTVELTPVSSSSSSSSSESSLACGDRNRDRDRDREEESNREVNREKGGGRSRSTSSSIEITAVVRCDGKTGVEMEALTAASTAALTVYDMCKAVDKGMWINGLRLVSKVGGKSGPWGEAAAAHEEQQEGPGRREARLDPSADFLKAFEEAGRHRRPKAGTKQWMP